MDESTPDPNSSEADVTLGVGKAAPPFPFELVAAVALAFMPRAPKKGLAAVDSTLYGQAAFAALRFLESCRAAYDAHESRQRTVCDDLRLAAKLITRFPDGIPFKNAIIMITLKKSEAEALPFYKQFLRECVFYNRCIHQLSPITDDMVEKELAVLRNRKFTHFDISRESAEFAGWRAHGRDTRSAKRKTTKKQQSFKKTF